MYQLWRERNSERARGGVRDTVNPQSELSPLNLRNSWIPSASLYTSNRVFIVASLALEEGYFYSLQDDAGFQRDRKTKVVGQWYNGAIWRTYVYLF